MFLRHLAIMGMLVFATAPTYAATAAGNIEAGRDLVTKSCTSCHAAGETVKASDSAPPLSFIARDNKERPAWVRGWLMDPHPPMPGIMLSRQQINDVIAYLGSLPVRPTASAFAGAAVAQESVSAKQGLVLAQGVCSECHAVRAGDGVSPNAKAPSFTSVANTSGMNEMALKVWFQTPHPTMPNLRISDQDSDNVVAYILSLKKR